MTWNQLIRIVAAAAAAVFLAALAGVAVASVDVSRSARVAASAGMRPAERCPGAVRVTDGVNDTRSWTLPPPPGPAVIPRSADLVRFELRATSNGVCVRWTTAAVAPAGTTFLFRAQGPWTQAAGGGQVSRGYGFYLDLGPNGARATFGLARLGSSAPHVFRVRAGQTGSVVSAFLRKEWLTPPANQRDDWAYVYRVFSFEARVLSRPDASGNRRVDFLPEEGPGELPIAGYINGALCGPPCHDPRFSPH
jgi:hypothetical protein